MQRIAVVTGANKGIGYEIAKQLLTTCTVVVLACRNKELGEAAFAQWDDDGSSELCQGEVSSLPEDAI